MNYSHIANHPLMWGAAILAVSLIFIQSTIFVRKSIVAGRHLGLSDSQMKAAFKTSIFSSIGPSIVILVGLVSMLTTVGGPTAWMRLSLIGSVSHELMGVEFAANSMGASIGHESFDELVFANAIWVLALGSFCWPLLTGLFTHRIDKVRKVVAGDNAKALGIFSAAASLGAFSFLVSWNLVPTGFIPNDYTLACVLGGGIMAGIMIFNKERNITWLREWSLAIAMFGSMTVTALV